MTPRKLLTTVAAEPKAARAVPQTIFPDGEIPSGEYPRVSFRDKADLAVGLACLVVLLGTISFSELDNNYATSMRMTAAIQRVFGILRPAEKRAVHVGGPAPQAGRIILVADDDYGQRLIAKTTLERYGYVVALADNGPQAVAFFRKAAYRVALVLLGQSAGQDSGEATVEQLKSIRPDVRILVSQPPGEKPAAGSHAVGRIEKPFRAMPLAEAVERALRSR